MTQTSARVALPAGVWALGLVSLCMDASSELVHALLPLYVTGTLGASAAMLGLLEGIAEATAAIVKVFSGVLSDRVGRRKPLVVLGYALAALSKPAFPLAHSLSLVFAARFVDRVGKGIRGAPRDALLAELTTPAQRGAAFGLRQSLDSVGAFLGPLLAIALMLVHAGDVRAVLWAAVVPAVLAVIALVVGVREPATMVAAGARRLRWRDARELTAAYWTVVAAGAVFALARFSEAFLILHGAERGLDPAFAPLVMVVMAAAYALSAYPAGLWADRGRPRTILVVGLLVLVAADLVLAVAVGPAAVLSGTALWGVHMGLTQGLLSKLVADAAPARLLGSAYGVFNLVSGVALLLASLVAGLLWEGYGAAATFGAGAVFAVLAAAMLVLSARPS
ncbi:MAG: MFS transporter [Gammaproteobacteria bacterium]